MLSAGFVGIFIFFFFCFFFWGWWGRCVCGEVGLWGEGVVLRCCWCWGSNIVLCYILFHIILSYCILKSLFHFICLLSLTFFFSSVAEWVNLFNIPTSSLWFCHVGAASLRLFSSFMCVCCLSRPDEGPVDATWCSQPVCNAERLRLPYVTLRFYTRVCS